MRVNGPYAKFTIPNFNRKKRLAAQSKSGGGRSQATKTSTGAANADYWRVLRWTRSLLPEKLRTIFRFQYQATWNHGAGVYAQTQISMNSPFDALYTIGGGVCTGFPNLIALYSRFFVRKARLQSQISSITASVADLHYILPVRSDEAAGGVIPNLDMITEGQAGTFNMLATTPQTQLVLRSTLSPSKFQGLTNQNKDELSGSIALDPVIQPAWYVGTYSTSGAVGHNMTAVLFVEYDTELYRPNTLSDA